MSLRAGDVWSSDGCKTTSLDDDTFECTCNHNTSFAIILVCNSYSAHCALYDIMISK